MEKNYRETKSFWGQYTRVTV